MDELTNSFIQVSSDLSIVELDVPFGLMFVPGESINAYRNLVVLAVVTWKVLFVVNTAHVFRPSISTEYMFMLYMLFIIFFIANYEDHYCYERMWFSVIKSNSLY